MGDGFFGVVKAEAGFAEIGMDRGILRVQGEGLLNQRNGGSVLTGGVREYAKQVQGAGVVRLHGEDLAVEGLGFAQPTGFVVLHGDLESALDRD